MCLLKSSFNHSVAIKIGKVIVDLREENITSKCFSWDFKEPKLSGHIKLNPTNFTLFQSNLNKNVSYYKVVGEEKKD